MAPLIRVPWGRPIRTPFENRMLISVAGGTAESPDESSNLTLLNSPTPIGGPSGVELASEVPHVAEGPSISGNTSVQVIPTVVPPAQASGGDEGNSTKALESTHSIKGPGPIIATPISATVTAATIPTGVIFTSDPLESLPNITALPSPISSGGLRSPTIRSQVPTISSSDISPSLVQPESPLQLASNRLVTKTVTNNGITSVPLPVLPLSTMKGPLTVMRFITTEVASNIVAPTSVIPKDSVVHFLTKSSTTTPPSHNGSPSENGGNHSSTEADSPLITTATPRGSNSGEMTLQSPASLTIATATVDDSTHVQIKETPTKAREMAGPGVGEGSPSTPTPFIKTVVVMTTSQKTLTSGASVITIPLTFTSTQVLSTEIPVPAGPVSGLSETKSSPKNGAIIGGIVGGVIIILALSVLAWILFRRHCRNQEKRVLLFASPDPFTGSNPSPQLASSPPTRTITNAYLSHHSSSDADYHSMAQTIISRTPITHRKPVLYLDNLEVDVSSRRSNQTNSTTASLNPVHVHPVEVENPFADPVRNSSDDHMPGVPAVILPAIHLHDKRYSIVSAPGPGSKGGGLVL